MTKIQDILILKEAERDLNDGKIFYNQRGSGIGDYFWDSLIADIESLGIYAGIHSKKYGMYRMLSKRFPYAVYYIIKQKIAYISAILPMRRNTEWIENQLKERNKL